MPSRRRYAVVIAAVLALAGCDDASVTPPRTPTPAASGSTGLACDHPGRTDSEPALGAGFDYDEEHHGFDEAVPVTLCLSNSGGPTLRFSGDAPGMVVEPALQEGEGPLFRFTVEVSPGSTAALLVETLDARGEVGGRFTGPRVVTDETGWSFQPWGSTAG